MNIALQIKVIREHFCGGSNKEFAEFMGENVNTTSNWINSEAVGINVVEKIISKFPEVNPGWLLTGEGDMLKGESPSNLAAGNTEAYTLVPIYNFDAVGGMDRANEITDAPAYIEKYMPMPDARVDDICVHVTGNSMIPTYSPGSLLIVRKVEGWREYFGYGHSYMLLLKDGRRILKEVRRSEDDPKRYILCVSHNNGHDPEELPRDFIVDVYKVIRTLTNEGF